jgi:hypothetical protein
MGNLLADADDGEVDMILHMGDHGEASASFSLRLFCSSQPYLVNPQPVRA